MRAIARGARLIVMDEPTAAPTRDEAERLMGIVATSPPMKPRRSLISHYLEELLSVCDEITVMRDGRIVRTNQASRKTPRSLVLAMIGRDLALRDPANAGAGSAPVALEARELRRAGALQDAR